MPSNSNNLIRTQLMTHRRFAQNKFDIVSNHKLHLSHDTAINIPTNQTHLSSTPSPSQATPHHTKYHKLNYITMQLKCRNYTEWKSFFSSTFLCSYSLFCDVDGSIPSPPSTNLSYATRCCIDDIIWSWIFATLSKTLLEGVHNFPSARTVFLCSSSTVC